MIYYQMLSLIWLSFVYSQSVPTPGQFSRFRAAPENSLLSVVPVDGAEFLNGQYFDISIELHSIGNKLPDIGGISASVNGVNMEQFFNASFSQEDSWNFTYFKDAEARDEKDHTLVSVKRLALRSVQINTAGSYHVKVTVGSEIVNAHWTVRKSSKRLVKNLILFIGDGMAPTMISAARYISRNTTFGKFKDNFLSFEAMGSVGKISTNGVDSMITDSANSAAAYMTGHKTWVNALNVYADTSSSSFDDPKVETIAEYIRRTRPNMCIGVVTTAAVQDATPASVYSHTRHRDTFAAITDQFVHRNQSLKWIPEPVRADVLMGGGGAKFCNTVLEDGSSHCSSLNNESYYDIYSNLGYEIVKNQRDLDQYNGTKPLLGIFALNHMDTWIDRSLYRDNLNLSKSNPDGNGKSATDQPGLELMTMKAIEVMSARCKDGFFMLSEAAAVDKSMHSFDYERGLADLLELDRTVKKAIDWNEKNGKHTGIIVTADHSQTFDVFGSVDTAYFNSLPNDDSKLLHGSDEWNERQKQLQILKRSAIGTYENAGWPDLVVDETGNPTKWEGRYRLANGKVDATQHTESYQLHKIPDASTNPLTRMVSVKDESLSALLNTTIYSGNPLEHDGLHVSANLPVGEYHAVHSLQAVDIYCSGPDYFQYRCSKVMDNTELFFIMADALGLGNEDETVEEYLNSSVLSSASNFEVSFVLGIFMILIFG